MFDKRRNKKTKVLLKKKKKAFGRKKQTLQVFLISPRTLHLFCANILKTSKQRKRQQTGFRVLLVNVVHAQTSLLELVLFHFELPKLILPSDC